MIVRIKNQEYNRFVDCACCVTVPPIKGGEGKPDEWSIIYSFENGKDVTFPLVANDEIYIMNDGGKTVHKDLRMLRSDNQ